MSLRNWTFRETTEFLKQHGFLHKKGTGSHFQYIKHTKERKFLVVVPFHGGASIPIGTMHSIVRQSGIPKKEWKKIKS